MRCPQALAVRWALAVPALLSYPARAAEPAASTATPSATTEAARAHFKNGVKLYQDQSYSGRAWPNSRRPTRSGRALARCETSRFAQQPCSVTRTQPMRSNGCSAITGPELSDAERSAAEHAKAELDALVGRVRLEASPANADVTLDGQAVPTPSARGTRRARGTSASTRFRLRAPGHARATRLSRVAQEGEALEVQTRPGRHGRRARHHRTRLGCRHRDRRQAGRVRTLRGTRHARRTAPRADLQGRRASVRDARERRARRHARRAELRDASRRRPSPTSSPAKRRRAAREPNQPKSPRSAGTRWLRSVCSAPRRRPFASTWPTPSPARWGSACAADGVSTPPSP